MSPWIVTLITLAVAIALFVFWQRARAGQLRAEIERQAAERALRAAEGETRRAVEQRAALEEAESDPILLIAPDRTVQALNAAAIALFGSKAAPGETVMVVTRSVELDELVAHVLAGGEDRDRQVMLNSQPFRVRAIPAGDFGLAMVLKDLSELQRLGRARRDFIANISHELRTPITSIRLVVDSLLSGRAQDARESTVLLQTISRDVQVLEQMAQELLDLAQIESGQAIVRLVPTPVEQLVHSAVERLKPQAEHKQQRLEVSVAPGLTALADVDMVSRALGNLLHNAIKFTPPEGLVRVQARRANGDVLIQVSDTGPGIPAHDLPRVFERFFRGDRSRRSGGTGLGLAIAKHVVEAHGGRLWVESQGVAGQGATFSFTLLPGEPSEML